MCNFADDSTLYALDNNLDKVCTKLEMDVKVTLKWLHDNSMSANASKFQLMFLGKKQGQHRLCLDINGQIIKPTTSVKLLGIAIDDKLNFDKHITELCKKATAKTNALRRIVYYIDDNKAKLLFNTYFNSTFNYCPLIWMFSSKTANNKINRVHKRGLKILHNSKTGTYDDLLKLDQSSSIHIKNIQALMTEVYKTTKKLNPSFMWDLFSVKASNHNLRSNNLLNLGKISNNKGSNSFTHRGAILWNKLSDTIKNSINLASFKKAIKTIDGKNCTCKICQQ